MFIILFFVITSIYILITNGYSEEYAIINTLSANSFSSYPSEAHSACGNPNYDDPKGFCFGNNDVADDYLEIDLKDHYVIYSIGIKGRSDKSQWVTNFEFYYKTSDDPDWTLYYDPSILSGNVDNTNEVINDITNVLARYVRIKPTASFGWKSFKIEIYSSRYYYYSIGYDEYICSLSDSYSSGTGSLSDCSLLCYNSEICGHFMYKELSTECFLFNQCNLMLYDSNDNNAELEYITYHMERIGYTDNDYIMNGDKIKNICKWSKNRKYKLCADTTNGEMIKLTNYDGSEIINQNLGRKMTLEESNGICTLETILSSGFWTWRQSFDTGSDNCYLHVTNYGELVLRNENDEILWSLGAGSDFNEGETLENIKLAKPTFSRKCKGILNKAKGDGESISDQAITGMRIAGMVAGMIGGMGQQAGQGLKAGATIWNYYSNDDDLSGIVKCLIEYTDYRIETLEESMEAFDILSFTSSVSNLIDDLNEANTIRSRIEKFDDGKKFTDIAAYLQDAVLGTYPRSVIGVSVALINLRMAYWSYIVQSIGCEDNECIVDYIKDNDDSSQSLKQSMLNFREDNGKFFSKYITLLPVLWKEIMEDMEITTQQRHDELHAIWNDGAFCRFWLPRTYDMSSNFLGCVDNGGDLCDETNPGNDYLYEQNWIFEEPTGDRFDNFGDDGYDFTSSHFECEQIFFNLITDEIGTTFNWNIKDSVFGFDKYEQWVERCEDSGWNTPETCQNCYGISEAEKYNFAFSNLVCSGNNNYISGLAVNSWIDEDKKGSIIDRGADFEKLRPLLKEITKIHCRNINLNSESEVTPNPDHDKYRLQFWDEKNYAFCYGGGNNREQLYSEGTCSDNSIATGIQFYRGYDNAKHKHANYLVWKIRLQCRYIKDEYYEWRIDNYILTTEIGFDIDRDLEWWNDGSVELKYEGWGQIVECPPKMAIYKIEVKDGWKKTADDGDQNKLGYGIKIYCKQIEHTTTVPAKIEIPIKIPETFDNDGYYYKYNNFKNDNNGSNHFKLVKYYFMITVIISLMIINVIVIGMCYYHKIYKQRIDTKVQYKSVSVQSTDTEETYINNN